MTFIDWCIDAFWNITDFFSNLIDWFTDKFDGITGITDNIFGDANGIAIGLTFIVGMYVVISLFLDPFHMGMNKLPILTRLIISVGIFPITYFISAKMLD